MIKYMIILALILLATVNALGQEWPKVSHEGSVPSSGDGTRQKFMYYKSNASEPKPLIVSLHQWSSGYRQVKGSLVTQTIGRDWNYIHPDFRGPNNHVKACCSDYVISDIDDAITWAIENMQVDTDQIHVIGASGGGYTALCHLMRSNLPVNSYHAYVPITNLESWYEQSISRQNKYAADILACTGSTDSLNRTEARKRSPAHMATDINRHGLTRVHLYAGIHDGYTGSVPVTHSLKFYNKLLKDLGASDPGLYVTKEDQIRLISARFYPNPEGEQFGGRKVHYHKKFGNVEVLIFEGGHEILENAALNALPNRAKSKN